MSKERRTFLKIALGAGVAGASTLIGAPYGRADDQNSSPSDSNGVVRGHSPKKEILYRKTKEWERYYKAAY